MKSETPKNTKKRHKKNVKETKKKSEDDGVVSISAYPHFLFHVAIEAHHQKTIVCPTPASSYSHSSPFTIDGLVR